MEYLLSHPGCSQHFDSGSIQAVRIIHLLIFLKNIIFLQLFRYKFNRLFKNNLTFYTQQRTFTF